MIWWSPPNTSMSNYPSLCNKQVTVSKKIFKNCTCTNYRQHSSLTQEFWHIHTNALTHTYPLIQDNHPHLVTSKKMHKCSDNHSLFTTDISTNTLEDMQAVISMLAYPAKNHSDILLIHFKLSSEHSLHPWDWSSQDFFFLKNQENKRSNKWSHSFP